MIPHSLAYNHRMKKFASIVCAVLLATLLALPLAACTKPSTSSSSAVSSAANVTSSSATTVSSDSADASAFSSNTATPPTPSDDSYAENHLVNEVYTPPADLTVTKNGEYSDKDHVALYIHTYGTVPSNFISKNKARKAGWVNTKGNLWDVLPGKSIGGGGFSNDDYTMPDADGREWFECDIDYNGGFRNSKRIVYSNDGLIYYTDDHYNTFQRLY